MHEEYLEEKGRLRKTVASNYVQYGEPVVLKCKEHRDSITCLCLSSNGQFLYSGSKDGSLVKCMLHLLILLINSNFPINPSHVYICTCTLGSLKERTKLKAIKGKRKNQEGIKCVQCIAVSTDGKFLVRLDKFSI